MSDHLQWDCEHGWIYTGGSDLFYLYQVKQAPWWYAAFQDARWALYYEGLRGMEWLTARINFLRLKYGAGHVRAFVSDEDPFAEGEWK